MLGTERFVLPEKEGDDPRIADDFVGTNFTGEVITSKSQSKRKPLSPAIDLCIGRKISDLTQLLDISKKDSEGKVLDNFGVILAKREIGNEDIEHIEIDKTLDIQGKVPLVGEFIDYDPTNCLSRIYMTNSPKIDEIFAFPSLPEVENQADLESQNYPAELLDVRGYGTAAIYGQNVRVRSDATMKLYNSLGKSMIAMTPEGDIVIQGNTDGGAKIVLEADGDIRIVPGETGIVKIGADMFNGDTSIIGRVPITAVARPGVPLDLPDGPKVDTIPVVTSGGATVVGGGSGKLSTKVIIV